MSHRLQQRKQMLRVETIAHIFLTEFVYSQILLIYNSFYLYLFLIQNLIKIIGDISDFFSK